MRRGKWLAVFLMLVLVLGSVSGVAVAADPPSPWGPAPVAPAGSVGYLPVFPDSAQLQAGGYNNTLVFYVDSPQYISQVGLYLAGASWSTNPADTTAINSTLVLGKDNTGLPFDPNNGPASTNQFASVASWAFTGGTSGNGLTKGSAGRWWTVPVNYQLLANTWYKIDFNGMSGVVLPALKADTTVTGWTQPLPRGWHMHPYSPSVGWANERANTWLAVTEEPLAGATLAVAWDQVNYGAYSHWPIGTETQFIVHGGMFGFDAHVTVGTATSAVMVWDNVDKGPVAVNADGTIHMDGTAIGITDTGYGPHSFHIRVADATSTAVTPDITIVYPEGWVLIGPDDGSAVLVGPQQTVTAPVTYKIRVKTSVYKALGLVFNNDATRVYQNLSNVNTFSVDLSASQWLEGPGANVLKIVAQYDDVRAPEEYTFYLTKPVAPTGPWGQFTFPRAQSVVGQPLALYGLVGNTGGEAVSVVLDGRSIAVTPDGAGNWTTTQQGLVPGDHAADLYIGDTPMAHTDFNVGSSVPPGQTAGDNYQVPGLGSGSSSADGAAGSFFGWLMQPTPGGQAALGEFRSATSDVFGFIGSFWQVVPGYVHLAVFAVLTLLVVFTLLKLRV